MYIRFNSIIYNYVKDRHGHKAKLLFTDTNSWTYEIPTDDESEDFYRDRDKFDLSEYPKIQDFIIQAKRWLLK